LLGGIAAGAAMIWNAPQAGARTREQVLETIEGALFKLLDMPVTLTPASHAHSPATEHAASATQSAG
jgi:hypothetical protein